jgi:hypothetical protein
VRGLEIRLYTGLMIEKRFRTQLQVALVIYTRHGNLYYAGVKTATATSKTSVVGF